MTRSYPTLVNGQYPINLLAHRRDFHESTPEWEAPRLAHMHAHVQPGDVIYDVGAEEGDFTALYQQWTGETGKVIPIEPQRAYWPAIRATFEINGFPPPPAWWVGFAGREDSNPHERGYERGAEALDEGWPRCTRGEIKPDFGFCHLAQQADSIPVTRLDTFADVTGLAPDVIVMDIEGAEWDALQGASGLFEALYPRLVYVSLHEPPLREWYGKEVEDVHALMAGFGYEGEFIQFDHEEMWVYSPKGETTDDA